MPRAFACDVAPELPATYFDACSLRLKEHRQVLKNSRGSLFCGPNRTAYRALSRFPVGPRDLFVEGTVLTQSHRIVTYEGQRGCAMELAATDADATDITNVWLEQKVSAPWYRFQKWVSLFFLFCLAKVFLALFFFWQRFPRFFLGGQRSPRLFLATRLCCKSVSF